jgi:hypothetical protein
MSPSVLMMEDVEIMLLTPKREVLLCSSSSKRPPDIVKLAEIAEIVE